MPINTFEIFSNTINKKLFNPEIIFNDRRITIKSSKFIYNEKIYELDENVELEIPSVSNKTHMKIYIVYDVAKEETIAVTDYYEDGELPWVPIENEYVILHNLIDCTLFPNVVNADDIIINVYLMKLSNLIETN